MRLKWGLYAVITLIIILTGGLLIANGTDAVSQAENKKQGILNTEPNTAAFYVDLYIPESQIKKFRAEQKVKVHFPYFEEALIKEGVVTSAAPSPQFANLRMTREKGQADVSMFLIRISIPASEELLPGMTAEVQLDEITG
ncbi:HlyD family efflux transporter periplasmic adaptor subunit [Paenibacillus maysiensis]|uniref:HlyD family efflux transporter periplasmic adaptor subunit n=1 Tax=Paenibacillus maysiensis TaxID=1155954 RepID=UPI00046F2F90|nr:HlyD family efflux transporter periplasmic adaptor subunit [Paenibacillus maysiensis]